MKALILNNSVVDIAENEFEVHSSLTWMDCPDDCDPQWTVVDGVLTAPAPALPSSYSSLRFGGYPNIGDQLDALFHAGVFPEDMAAQIQAVKDKYPKD